MFKQLLNLYKKHSQKTPLEDFTTESFVGILNIEEKIKNAYLTDFLKLPPDTYQIRTQSKYPLNDDPNCIIDVVIKGNNNVCFIENKVDSSEGYRQLERYSIALDTYYPEKTTFLFYCTKFHDSKTHIGNNFRQFRWFEIAKFLNKYKKNNLIGDFLQFLKANDMANDLTLSAKDFITLNNLQNTIDITSSYLERVKPFFETTFKSKNKISDGRSIKDILSHNRLIYVQKDIVEGGGYSEIKYGFQLQNPNIYTSIWIAKSNPFFEQISLLSKNSKFEFKIFNNDLGIAIELKKDISSYLNNENADDDIVKWFKESFGKFATFINETKENVKWKINCH